MPAAAIGAVGAIASASSAAAAVGALATAGTAALTVGSVASIATFVGSVTTVVGAVTGNQDLLKVGSVLGVVGGVTNVAANGLKIFGESQTLGAAVKTANVLNAAQQTVATGANLDFSLANAATPPQNGINLTSVAPSMNTGVSLPGMNSVSLPGVDVTQGATTTANAATATNPLTSTTSALAAANTPIDTSLLGGATPPNPGVDLGTGVLTGPAAPGVPDPVLGDTINTSTAGSGSGFSFDTVKDFFNNPANARTKQGIGQAWQAVNQYLQTEQLGKLREAQSNLYNTEAGILRQKMTNASAAADLYRGRYG